MGGRGRGSEGIEIDWSIQAYSYKDQMAELQLMKELAEKRRKEGKMTPKQKEMMDKELAKEKVRMNRECLTLLYYIAGDP